MPEKDDKAKKAAVRTPVVSTSAGWSGARPWVGSIAILGLLVFEYIFISNGFGNWRWPISILVPMSGVMAFFGVLFISNVYSKNPDLSNGEMRKAITAGVVVTYLFFIVTILFSSASPIYRLSTPTEEPAVTEASPDADSSSSLFLVRQDATPEPTEEPGTGTDDEAVQPETDAQDTQETTIDTPLQLAASITNAFTTLVAVVVGFYFTTRTVDTYNKLQALKANPELAKIINEED